MTKTYLKYRNRVMVISCLVILSWAGLAVRLFQVQVLSGEKYQVRGMSQGQYREPIFPIRGNIYDRNNIPLTRNIIHYSVGANPAQVRDKKELAKKMEEATGRSREVYLNKLNSKKSFVYLERNMRKDLFTALQITGLAGIVIERDARRFYPHDRVAAQILGLTDVDDNGIFGLEKEYDSYLQGIPGWVMKQRNGLGEINPKSNFPSKPPVDGFNIQTTIDLDYQSVLQDELTRWMDYMKSRSATALILDPQTGDILAMASIPDFDPNSAGSFPVENQKIRAITDQFEPGSTFKIVAAAAAIDKQTVSLTQEFNCEMGSYQLKDVRINDHEEYDLLTLSQIIQHSSNIGIIKVAQTLGNNTLYRYIRDFGFGMPTQIHLTGEVPGTVRRVSDWSDISLPEVAMGQEVAVTGIQLACAYAAVANGGYLLKPRLIKQIVDQDGNVIEQMAPEVVRKITDPDVMATIKDMLIRVVEGGTGINAAIPGWSVAGKTGTAQKYIDGEYSKSKFVSNFVGFFPADKPQLLGVFIVDEPRYGFHWGSEGAAPLFRRVMERIINLDDDLKAPDFSPESPAQVMILAKADELPVSTPVTRQPATPMLQSAGLYRSSPDNLKIIPEVRGMSLKKALTTLRQAHLKVKVNGSGKVVWQSPSAGTRATSGQQCEIGLQ